jgi:hypothetical protein
LTPSTNFPAPYDRTTKIVTLVVCLALLAIAVAIRNVIVAPLSLLTIVLGYAYSPRGYTIVDRSIVVKRLIGNVRVPLEDVREARLASSDDFSGCIRLWGSGGLFGYYGLFRTNKLGRCTWYASDRSRTVVLITASKTAVFSPADPEGFLRAIREKALFQASAGSPVYNRPLPDKVNTKLVRLTMGIIVVVAVLLAGRSLVGVWSYNPGSPVYDLTGDSLAIHDRFYPVTIGAAATETVGIRVVDLDQETGWRPTLRVGGFANAHYQSGWYRTANGTRMRLYRERSAHRVVLLPSKSGDAPVLLQVPDPDQFIEQIRRDWAGR